MASIAIHFADHPAHPGCCSSAQVLAPLSLTPDQTRFGLFDSLSRVLQRAARREPLLIFLEDLHWADTLTMLMLQFVSQHVDFGALQRLLRVAFDRLSILATRVAATSTATIATSSAHAG